MILAPILQLPSSLLFLLILVFNPSLQVTSIGIVHNDTKLSLLRFVHLAEANNVGVLQHLEDLCLAQSFPPLVLVHVLDIDLLDDCVLLVGLALHEVRRSEGADTQRLDFLVRFVLLLWLWWL